MPAPGRSLPAVVEAALTARFGLRCTVTAHPPGSLPRVRDKAVRVTRRDCGAAVATGVVTGGFAGCDVCVRPGACEVEPR